MVLQRQRYLVSVKVVRVAWSNNYTVLSISDNIYLMCTKRISTPLRRNYLNRPINHDNADTSRIRLSKN